MGRSNRQLTQFAVDKFREYMRYGPEGFEDETQANTEVRFDGTLGVYLFDKKIMHLAFSSFNDRLIAEVGVFTGEFYDSKGLPSRTTRERLNGLLDALGTAQFIPSGVRVFIQNDACYLGRGDECKPFDSDNESILLQSHPTDVVFS